MPSTISLQKQAGDGANGGLAGGNVKFFDAVARAGPGSAVNTAKFGSAADSTREPRVYLECTTTRSSRYRTGIQRTVRSLVEEALNLPGPPICVPIVYNGRYFETIDRLPAPRRAQGRPSGVEKLRRIFHFARAGAIRFFPFVVVRAHLNSPRFEFALRRAVYAVQNLRRWLESFYGRRDRRPIVFEAGDVVVLLDATWGIDLSRELRRAKDAGARVWTVVQDLIPINHPEFAPEGLPLLLDAWLQRTIPLSDGLLAISRTVAGDLRAYMRERLPSGAEPPYIDSFHLGSGFDPPPAGAADHSRLREAFQRCSDGVYLVVGTIEPRKDCARILAAFERLWMEGSDAALMLFGRAGWRSYELIDRIRMHPERDRRLFWFEDGSDAELDFAYRHAVALIFASHCEGFGLPLVEAMHYGLPVLAADIAVFREIGGDYPDFFQAGDERAIHDSVRGFASRRSESDATHTPESWLSWADSARMLLAKVTAPRDSTVGERAASTACGSGLPR